MKESIWMDSVSIPKKQKLQKDLNTDILIIGGGICGVLCAYFLDQMNADYILVEGDRIGQGITKNTTAKITSQHGIIYDKLIKTQGIENATKYLRINERAISQYQMLSETIDCDFEYKDAYTYSLTDRRMIDLEVEKVNSIGYPAEFAENLPLPFETLGAIKFKNQAQFNPIKFLSGITKGLNIYENTFIRSLDGNTAASDGGKITANKIIVATHFPFINTHGSYFLKMYQHRSYVIALENAPNLDGMYVDEAQKGLSFRNYKDLLLIGGGDHRTGKKGGNWTELRHFAHQYYSKSKERYYWATQDCMSLDGIPYIGHYSKRTNDLYVASGFNKWGMSSSMVAAMILSDMVMGRENEYKNVFSPHRNILKPQLFVNGFEAVTNLLTPSAKRCPHLGCALKWNKAEHTWDCPCHGSRFGENGSLIDNPSTGDAKVKK